ncbi:MAG: hypothetical protein VX454_09705 [Pseudomonadota bacterium]|nr:hypothetical protein [Pseudomonadota bacterium]
MRLAKAEPFDPLAAEAPTVGVRIEIGIRNLAVAALQLDTEQGRMAKDILLGQWIAGQFGLKSFGAIDVRHDCEAAAILHQIEDIDDAGGTARIRRVAIDQAQPCMEAGQGIEGWQITEQMAMCGRQLDSGNYEKVTTIGGLDRRSDSCDFVVIGDGNQIETFGERCLDDRDGGRGCVSHIMGTSYAVNVEIAPEKPSPVVQLKSVSDIHPIPHQAGSAEPFAARNKDNSLFTRRLSKATASHLAL